MIYALGAFDGFHRGHAELLNSARELALQTGEEWGVATFDANPRFLLGGKNFKTLFSDTERDFFAKYLAVPKLLKIAFTGEFAAMSPLDFMQFMTEKYDLTAIVAGENFRFGKERAGDTAFIKDYCAKKEIAAKIVPSVLYKGEILSSTLIRSLLCEGNVKEAGELLGLPYFVRQKVLRGEGRGHKLGFPTANFCCEETKLYPASGSYFTLTLAEGKIYPSVTNIGFNPTFGAKRKSCETHIIDFDDDIYGKIITVFFIGQNRAEKKFKEQKELTLQLSLDVAAAKIAFSSYIAANARFINNIAALT